MSDARIGIVYELLDLQIVDADGRRCGRVDDVELRADGDALDVSALLTGRGVLPARLPQRLRGLGRRVFGRSVLGETVHRVPAGAIDRIDSAVHLRCKAAELDLAAADRDLERWMAKVPGR
jgi:sporulation protein YlmC with PRC-barrel domain